MIDNKPTEVDEIIGEEKMMLDGKLDEIQVEGGGSLMISEIQKDEVELKELEGPAKGSGKDANRLDRRTGRKKPVSEKQLLANRRNAKKGGVKTPQGKAKTRLNAVRHGLLCQDLVLPSEDECAFAELRERFITDLQPAGELEKLLVLRIASGFWRLDRALRVETALLARNIDRHDAYVLRFPDQACPPMAACGLETENLQKLLRYETPIEKQIYKAKQELERSQMARKGAAPPQPLAIEMALTNES